MLRTSNIAALLELKAVFAKSDARGALEYLNSLTDHRFTCMYRFDGETLHNITFFDRENPALHSCEDIPLTASYCVFIRDSGVNFTTEDARHDDQVGDHPKRATVQSYCGVPLLDRDGQMFGSICHFDFKPGGIANVDVELLERMAQLLKTQLP